MNTKPLKALAATMLIGATAVAASLVTAQPAVAATRVTQNAAGDLTITGDNSSQIVSIKSGFEVIVESESSVTTYVINRPIRDLRVNLKGGDDGFHINYPGYVELSRDLIVNLGGGRNASELARLVVGRNFRLTDGSGDSSLRMSHTYIERHSTIRVGGGENDIDTREAIWGGNVSITSAASGSLEVAARSDAYLGTYRLTSGNKHDELSYHSDTAFSKKMTVNTRGGDDTILYRDFVYHYADADIRMGSGADRADLFLNQAQRNFRFRGEGGDDQLSITGGSYQGSTTFDGGGGQDLLTGEAVVFATPPNVISFEAS